MPLLLRKKTTARF